MTSQRFGVLPVTAAALAAVLLAASGCNNSATSSGPPPPPSSNGAMFITDFTNNTITVYGQSANCVCNPARQIAGGNTQLSSPLGIAVDNSGTIYVASSGNAKVLEFPGGGMGNIAPTFQIAGGFNSPSGVAVDAAKNVYVVDRNLNSLQIFAPGSAVPSNTISGPGTGLSGPDFVTLDAANDIWVSNQSGNSVEEFPPLSSNPNGNVTPTTIIAGTNTSLSSPQGLAFAPNGNLFVAINNPQFNSFDAVLVFSGWIPGQSNNIAPGNAICGAATGVNNPTGVAINPLGTVFVVNSQTALSAGYVTDFASNNVGNPFCSGPQPSASVSGPAFLNPAGIALH